MAAEKATALWMGAPGGFPGETERVLPTHSLWFAALMEGPEDAAEPRLLPEELELQGNPQMPGSPGGQSPRTYAHRWVSGERGCTFPGRLAATLGTVQTLDAGQLTITSCAKQRNELSTWKVAICKGTLWGPALQAPEKISAGTYSTLCLTHVPGNVLTEPHNVGINVIPSLRPRRVN